MSFVHLLWFSTGSTDRPMSFACRLVNSGSSFAMYPSSVVHTGVKSFGCEKRTAQWSPIHSWNLIGPCVVCAVKSGARSLIRRDMSISSRWERRSFGTAIVHVPEGVSSVADSRSMRELAAPVRLRLVCLDQGRDGLVARAAPLAQALDDPEPVCGRPV